MVCRAYPRPLKNDLKGLVHSPENILGAVIIPKCKITVVSNFFQLIRLGVVGKRFPLGPIGVSTFLQCGVIQAARFRQLESQPFRLSCRWMQPILERLSHYLLF
jgi:hypothetical protein